MACTTSLLGLLFFWKLGKRRKMDHCHHLAAPHFYKWPWSWTTKDKDPFLVPMEVYLVELENACYQGTQHSCSAIPSSNVQRKLGVLEPVHLVCVKFSHFNDCLCNLASSHFNGPGWCAAIQTKITLTTFKGFRIIGQSLTAYMTKNHCTLSTRSFMVTKNM